MKTLHRSLLLMALAGLILTPFVLAADDEQTKKEMGVFQDKGYVFFQTADGAFKYMLDGRAQIDYGNFLNADNEIPWGTETRRVRLAIKAIFNKDWAAEMDLDHSENELEIKDLWAAYIGIENTIIKFGNHKLFNSLEEVTSSRWVSFMERSLINAFVHDRRIGISVTRYGDNFTVMAGAFGEAPAEGETAGIDEGYAFSARGVFTPIIDDQNLLHIGASYSWSTPNASSGDVVRFRGRELHMMERIVDTGKIKYVDDYSVYGGELAYRNGPFSIQGEYLRTDVNRMADKGDDASFDGYYVFASWFPFAGMRTYDISSGEFAAVTVPEEGALELLVRFSHINLNDADVAVKGGKGDYITLGATYYFNDNVRAMVNYILTNHDANATSNGAYLGNDDFQILGARMAFFF